MRDASLWSCCCLRCARLTYSLSCIDRTDPAHVLERLKVAWAAPTAPPAPIAHRASISSVVEPSPNPNKGPADDDDDDDDPTRGYVQLDAPALSSTDPSIVEFDAPPPNPEEEGERGREKRRRRKFLDVLASDNVDLGELRKLAWSGVPDELRTMVWQLLLVRHLPSCRDRSRCRVLTKPRCPLAAARISCRATSPPHSRAAPRPSRASAPSTPRSCGRPSPAASAASTGPSGTRSASTCRGLVRGSSSGWRRRRRGAWRGCCMCGRSGTRRVGTCRG